MLSFFNLHTQRLLQHGCDRVGPKGHVLLERILWLTRLHGRKSPEPRLLSAETSSRRTDNFLFLRGSDCQGELSRGRHHFAAVKIPIRRMLLTGTTVVLNYRLTKPSTTGSFHHPASLLFKNLLNGLHDLARSDLRHRPEVRSLVCYALSSRAFLKCKGKAHSAPCAHENS